MKQLSKVIAGCMSWGEWGKKFTTAEYQQMIEGCLESGFYSFDHADIYGSYTTEEEFGAALKRNSFLRDKIQIITKCGIKMLSPQRPAHTLKSYDTSAKHILASAEQSLKNFGTDHLDILLIHRPDPLMHPEEIAKAFLLLKEQGKVLHFGVSNFLPSQLSLIHSFFPLEFHQLEISLLKMDALYNGQLDQCLELGIKPMAWAPLGGGQLFNNKDEKAEGITRASKVIEEKYKLSTDQVLLAFLHTHPSEIIPVLGTTKLERLKAANTSASLKLEREEWFSLWQASEGNEVP